MNLYIRVLWVALIALCPLAGCSPGSGLPELAAKPDVSYHLGPGDSVLIRVLGADELNGQYIVQDDGTVRMLLISSVPAAGLTADQLEAKKRREHEHIQSEFVIQELATSWVTICVTLCVTNAPICG